MFHSNHQRNKYDSPFHDPRSSIPAEVWKEMQARAVELSKRKVSGPKEFKAWEYPEHSVVYRMRGLRSCEKCQGNGYHWFQDSIVKEGCWIRCPACHLKMETIGEIEMRRVARARITRERPKEIIGKEAAAGPS